MATRLGYDLYISLWNFGEHQQLHFTSAVIKSIPFAPGENAWMDIISSTQVITCNQIIDIFPWREVDIEWLII